MDISTYANSRWEVLIKHKHFFTVLYHIRAFEGSTFDKVFMTLDSGTLILFFWQRHIWLVNDNTNNEGNNDLGHNPVLVAILRRGQPGLMRCIVYESCPWCRIDHSTCWPAVQRATIRTRKLPNDNDDNRYVDINPSLTKMAGILYFYAYLFNMLHNALYPFKLG